MKKLLLEVCLVLVGISLSGCSSDNTSYTDGKYTGKSSVYENEDGTDDGNGYGEVTVEFKDSKIIACEFLTYEPDGKLKDEEYGKVHGEIANRDFYNKAQKSNGACAEYAKEVVENGNIEDIDAISGATINYNSFVEAMDDVLEQAKLEQ